MKNQNDKQFMLVALRPFKTRSISFKTGDRCSPRMNYVDAVKQAKRHNIGHTVGVSKRVEVKPFINFKSSWERA